ncbi:MULTISPECIES: XRE family transcriptional regulator [Rhodomicrobium]|uniref:helix-turn-helix domain-containing protein n=1 Tax=Rhodomicrobium TaxID=1068 RepID=UPI000B4BDACB|nr:MULTISPECIES: XRE family transcriptional regulator [Rhodomicrobium]
MAEKASPTRRAAPETSMSEDAQHIGKLLRERRAHHNWTLADVARMTGISVSTLSKIENGLLSPTYDKILQLCRGLNVEVADLLEPKVPSERPEVVLARRSVSRQFEGQRIDTSHYSYSYLCSDVAHKRIIPIYIDVRATNREQMGELTSHVGEEYILVIAGRVRIYSEYYEEIELEAGDSIYIDSTMKHGFMSVGHASSRLLVTCSSATPNLAQTLREILKAKAARERGLSMEPGRDEE